jgi:two-component sensor histidine kinase
MPARLFVYRIPPQRIRTFLALFALALALPLLALALFALNRMASLEEAEIEQRVLQVAGDLAGDIDREIERVTVTLETLATSDALARGDLAAVHAHASRALKRDRAGILLVDREHKQLLNTRAAFGSALPPTSDPETAQKAFGTKQRQVSNLFMGVVSGQPIVNVWVPVLDAKQEVRYVLAMALDATRFESLLQAQSLEPQWITGITDNKGIILARSERHAEFVGKPLPKELLESSRAARGVFRATSVAGANILRATVRSRAAGWLVSATVPVSYVEASRRRGEVFAAAIIVTALALGGLLAYIFGGFMARPLDAATAAAEAVGLGKLVEPIKSPLVEANQLTAALSAASSELAARQEHSGFLMRELAHRSKNQLAVVNGMAMKTAGQSKSVAEFVRQFSQRILGLAESQDLMVRQNWQGAWLGDLVRAHLDLFGAGARVEVHGPALFLNANAVQNIGFALHELATNASKHGALASPEGRVLVSWRRSEAGGRVQLEWTEMDGPAVQLPQHRGFGSLIITELVAQALNGTAKLDFFPTGVHWLLDIPATHVLTTPAATATTPA